MSVPGSNFRQLSGTLFGNNRTRVCFLVTGMPFSLQPVTDGGLILNISATAEVPPSSSITSESVMGVDPRFAVILGAPKSEVKARLIKKMLGFPNMNTWHDRLNIALLESDFNKAALAKRIGVSAPTVTDWTKGGIKTINAENAEKLCKALGINSTWLLTGKGPMRGHESHRNVEAQTAPAGCVPLISWVNAGAWCESPDNYAPGDAEEWMPKPKNAGPRTFALRVINDSMTSPYPGQRSYSDGTIIYIDPDRAVTNGARVVARAGGEYTFKTYIEDAGRKFLKPINPTYDKIDITEDVDICGVVIGSYFPE